MDILGHQARQLCGRRQDDIGAAFGKTLDDSIEGKLNV